MIEANKNSNEPDSGDAVCHGREAAKWAAVIDDVVVPMPEREVAVELMRGLASVPPDFVLVRDHNSPHDVVLDDGAQVDLAQGNVFYRLNRCEVQPRDACHDVAKLAFIVNDRAEITIRPDLTGKLLRELFNLPLHSWLLRDVEGPVDEPIELESVVRFGDGPVFISREVQAQLKITVNSRIFTEHEGVKKDMTGLEIAALAYPENPSATQVWFVSEGNREVSLAEHVKIHGCEVFDVVRKEVTGGFEKSRVERELDQVRLGGLQVTLLPAPISAVVYHGLRTKPGATPASTDVLVPIPGGYPGQMLDWVYLPEDSPLIGRLKGTPQDNRITALERVWRRISYHPHSGGGAPAWNPTVHGLHTYLGEIISWLFNA